MNNSVNKKRIIIIVVAAIYLLAFIIAAAVYIIDPFFHFHKPLAGVKYSVNNQAFQNPGIARNFDYDSLIVGSSMTEKLYPSIFDSDYDCKTVKVSYSGGTSKNHNIILNQAFKYHDESIKYVFWGLDIYAVNVDVDEIKQDLPEYLYDDNKFNDLSYLLNKDVLYVIADNYKNGSEIDYDSMFNESDTALYCQQGALGYWNAEYVANAKMNQDSEVDVSNVMPSENVIKNLECNILPVIEENSDTRFIFFIPPYPIIRWSDSLEDGMSQLMCDLNYIFESINKYDNAELHMLQMMDGTDNLYIYKDTFHYNTVICKEISKALKSGDYLITEDNINPMLKKFADYVYEYDYSYYTGEEYPFQSINDYNTYIEAVDDDRYTKIVYTPGGMDHLEEPEADTLRRTYLREGQYEYLNEEVVIQGDSSKLQTLADRVICDTGSGGQGILIDGICYTDDIGDNRILWIIVYDNVHNRVADVAGLRSDTHVFEKY